MTFEKTIADNYAQYLEDERGYDYQAWDVTTIAQTRSHDQILHSTTQELAKIDPAALNDLERWALARAYRTHQQHENFVHVCAQLIASTTPHPALNYSEIFEAYLEQLARHGELDQALSILKNSTLTDLSRDLEGRITLFALDETSAQHIFENLIADHPDDAELRFDIAENFAHHGFSTSALKWLDDAQNIATRTRDDAILVDIELLRLEINENTHSTEE